MDGWLSLHGWVKIHGSWILYDGYMQGAHNMKVIPLTDIQIEKISLYGKVCHGDKLFCGLEKKFCSGTRFGFTDKPMLAKLFDATKNSENPKKKDLEMLKWICKNT